MKIGILSKRTNMFTGKIKKYYEKSGYTVNVFTLENLVINEDLFDNDFYILKSKNLFFLYAGYFLEANDVKVIPDPQVSFMQKHRIQSHYLLKKAGLVTPNFYLGSLETFRNSLDLSDFPLIIKPLMGSGSKGVKIINSIEDIQSNNNETLYMEKFITGEHYNAYFIGNQICTLVKPPLSNEHVDMEKIETPDDIIDVIRKWRNYLGERALFGHLDIVREEESNNLYIVDPGSFPEFSNWKCTISPVEEICNLILKHVGKY
ncbi:MAG: ATP-grasp domain-containing protein [Promethearchaeota archaeon]|jgi:hypothetical protein